MYYYLCDSDYRIIDKFQGIAIDLEDPVYLEQKEGDLSQPVTRAWRWYVEEPGKLTVKNLWYDETITVDIADVVPTEVTVNQEGAITVIKWKTEDDTWDAAVLAAGIIQDIPFSGKEGMIEIGLETQPNGVVRVFDRMTAKGLYYFLADGARLQVNETMEALYVSPQFQVLRDGSKLYVGDYEGKLTQLPVSMDEE